MIFGKTGKKGVLFWLATAAVFFFALGGPALGEGEFPQTDESGFLAEGEFVYENPDQGVWRYLSPTLRVEIFRRQDEEQRLVWTEAEIFTRQGERFHMIPYMAEKRMARMARPPVIARENGVVFAVNSDYAHLRIQQKIRPGILIRDGEIISKQTRTENSTKYPNLDTLALFPDGDMQVFRFNEHKAEDYLAMGAADVLAFGPILLRDGQMDEDILAKYGHYKEPRTGVGMVEPGHYFAIMAEGRHEDSKGISTLGLAKLFQQKGCTLALNLDGGQSATMLFMGRQIIRVGQSESANAQARSTAELLGIGHTDRTLAEDAD